MKKEIAHYADRYSEGREIDTIFFGGGTPSFVDPTYIDELIKCIDQHFSLSPNAEMTLETNPGTVSKEKLVKFKDAGINRLSIGIQSFDDEELKFLTRIHDENTAIETVHTAADAGFENISIDLIFSLPNQSFETWSANLKKAIELPIKHISAYSLILERGTILNKMVLDGKIKMTSENHDAELYKHTMEFLSEKGFEQYEVSNFSLPSYECLHNLYYWQHKDYFGLGTAAHSFVDGERWWNFSSLKKYTSEIDKNNHAVRGRERLSPKEMKDELIMLGLRSRGIKMDEIKGYSTDWYFEKKKIIDSFIDRRYLIEKDGILKCTQQGYLVCDEIISKLL